MKKLILVDGNSIMFRSFYATSYTGNLMKTKSGLYTNCLFGFCNMINKVLEMTDGYLFVAFDAGKQTFRHKEYSQYKGKRDKMPEELRVQIPYVKKYLDLIGVKRLETLDYEADDLIATASNLFYNDFDKIIVISGDKDLLQLTDEKITVCLTRKGVNELEEFTKDNFFDKMNINPSQLIDYKGLVGDSSDNLPGIKGIGEKTACKLLNEYQTIDNIINNIDLLKGKTKELIETGKDIGLKCKYLATLIKDAKIILSLDDIMIKDKDINALISFFQEVEFYSMIKKLDIKKEEDVISFKVLTKEDDLNLFLKGDSYFICETEKENYYKDDILGISFSFENDNVFLPKELLSKNEVKDYFESERYKKKTFDYKKAYVLLKKEGINLTGVSFDFLLASYLINPAYANDDIKVVSTFFEDNNLSYHSDIYGSGAKMKVPSLDIYAKHSINKALIIKKLENDIINKIKEYDLEYLLNVEMKLSKVLAEMEINGVNIDLDLLDGIGVEFDKRVKDIQNDIFEMAGCIINLSSPKQLGELLFDKMMLPHGKKTKTGYSTSADVLEKLAPNYEIVKKILEYRTLSKLLSTYVKGLKDEAFISLIHPLYKQALTLTGRLSSVNPNIQNIPTRTEDGQILRKVFTSRFENGKIISADYSQIELRVLAALSKDEKMIELFNSSIDFHSVTASQIYDKDITKVTKEERRAAKAINFGIVYGMSAWGLSEAINVSPIEANVYIARYFDTYKKVKEYLDETVKMASDKGYSKTLFGRRRYLPELKSENKNLKMFGERTSMNAPIQGTAADIIKIAMINVSERLKKEKLKSLMIIQVHDELVFDVYPGENDKVISIVKEEMENAVKESVVFKVEIQSGSNWFEAK